MIRQAPDSIETERMILRPPVLADAEAMAAYSANPNVTRYVSFAPEGGITARQAYIRDCMAGREAGRVLTYVPTLKATGALMGCCDLRFSPPRAELGYTFDEPYWGQGYAFEAATALVALAMSYEDIFRVFATCSPENVASVRVMEKLGMRLEARLNNWTQRPTMGLKAAPALMYSLLKDVP